MFGLDFILKLKPCKWRYRGVLDDGREHFGFIAQEVDELASKDIYAFVEVGSDGIYRLSLGEFVGPLVKAVQELSDKVALLERRLDGTAPCNKLGDNQAGNHDPLGNRYDLAADLGDV